MKPMLAHLYEPKRFKLPCCIQPKLDGVRGLEQRGRFVSRDQIEWAAVVVSHVSVSLSHYIPILDGEWYRHGWSLQKINGAIGVNRTIRVANTDQVAFHVFDLVDFEAPFIERWFRASEIVAACNNPSLRIVPAHPVESLEEVDHWFDYYRKLDYEGIMVRMGDGGYTQPSVRGLSDQDNRCWTMLKHKGWLDDEFEIIGVAEGKPSDRGGKYVGTLGALICKARNGKQFNVGSGMTDAERDEWWSNPPVGKQAKVKYRLLSDEGIPLNGTLILVL